jgi:hypothetical protein
LSADIKKLGTVPITIIKAKKEYPHGNERVLLLKMTLSFIG